MSSSKEALQIYERWLPQYRKGLLELIILLRLQQKMMYGYELASEIKTITSIDIAEGTLYPLLNRLKRDGLVTPEWQTMETGTPRKYYQITTLGRESLQLMKKEWSQSQSSIMQMVMQS